VRRGSPAAGGPGRPFAWAGDDMADRALADADADADAPARRRRALARRQEKRAAMS
jgi:hypothetical protein